VAVASTAASTASTAAISRWCAVASVPVPALGQLAQHLDLDGLHVYYRGPAGAKLAHPVDRPIEIDVRTLTPLAQRDVDEPVSTLRIDEQEVTARISALNTDPVYLAADRVRGRFAYFTDLFLAPIVLPALGIRVELFDGAPTHPRGTLVRGVDRLTHSTITTTRRISSGHAVRWTTRTSEEPDPLGDFLAPHRADAREAGEAQLEALAARIARIRAAADAGHGDVLSGGVQPGGALSGGAQHGGAPVSGAQPGFATLLSGGIDSGTVTWLAASSGVPVSPYSVGTPWGDEFDGAAELCTHLGIELRPVLLAEDDIIASIPEAVRWLCAADAENVEVALTATSAQRLGVVPGDLHVLTGYGSDLINAGLYQPFAEPGELTAQVLASVDRTRLSNELSNRMALAYGAAVDHPFWSWPVMRVALETAPECKVRDGREKFHLRTAMQARVPHAVAWRRKIAVHHGGGLQQGVVRRLEKETGVTDRAALYRACFAELVDAAAEGVLEPADHWPLFERAVRRVRGAVVNGANGMNSTNGTSAVNGPKRPNAAEGAAA
jgi:hypothetical protein